MNASAFNERDPRHNPRNISKSLAVFHVKLFWDDDTGWKHRQTQDEKAFENEKKRPQREETWAWGCVTLGGTKVKMYLRRSQRGARASRSPLIPLARST